MGKVVNPYRQSEWASALSGLRVDAYITARDNLIQDRDAGNLLPGGRRPTHGGFRDKGQDLALQVRVLTHTGLPPK